jgi:hypothetical protein
LSQAELDSLRIVLDGKITGTGIKAQLDSFGLLRHYGLVPRGNSAITDPAQAVSLAKNALVRLNDFSNISDTSALSVEEVTNYNPSPLDRSDWTVIFNNQSYNGLEVWNTRILTLVADNFILLDGHHFKNVFIPQKNIISKEQAKDSIIGKEIIFYGYGPSTFVIADSSIDLDSVKQCIYPFIKTNSIELRVAWKIPITIAHSKWPTWYYFSDILSGETLEVICLVIG